MSPLVPVVYRDDRLVAVIKPAGLLVHRTQLDAYERHNLVDRLLDQLGQQVYPVHRLDKPTSGLLLFAFDADCARALTTQFEQREVNKVYHAVVRGYTQEEGCIDYPIGDKDARHNKRLPAVTRYKTIAKLELPHRIDRYPTTRYSLVEVKPVTGRRHQIRQHMKHIHHPLIGDTSYGKAIHNKFFTTHYDCKRLLLHASGLTFTHPFSNSRIVLDAPITDTDIGDDGQFERVLTDGLWHQLTDSVDSRLP